MAQDTKQILLLKRAESIKHGGNICLPGGYRDNLVDINDIDTAIRETFEETGIDLKHRSIDENEFINSFETSYGHIVNAYFFKITSYPKITLSAESTAYILLDVDFINNKNNYSYNPNAKKHFLEIKHHNYNIWGITATILFAFANGISVDLL